MTFFFWPAVPCHRHKLSNKGIYFFPPWIELLQISVTWIVNRFLSFPYFLNSHRFNKIKRKIHFLILIRYSIEIIARDYYDYYYRDFTLYKRWEKEVHEQLFFIRIGIVTGCYRYFKAVEKIITIHTYIQIQSVEKRKKVEIWMKYWIFVGWWCWQTHIFTKINWPYKNDPSQQQ